MNAARRKEIHAIAEAIEELAGRVSIIINDEQDAHDNLPEGIQSSERGERMEEAIDRLGDAQCSLDDVAAEVREVIA